MTKPAPSHIRHPGEPRIGSGAGAGVQRFGFSEKAECLYNYKTVNKMKRVFRRGTMKKSSLRVKFDEWKRSPCNTIDMKTTPTLWTTLLFGFGLYDCISSPPGNQTSLDHFKKLAEVRDKE
jgi:hypothetical protein